MTSQMLDLDQVVAFLIKNAKQKLIQIKAELSYKPFETICF
jgi:hypothetical protein